MNAQIGANAPPSRIPWPPVLMTMTLAAEFWAEQRFCTTQSKLQWVQKAAT